MTIFKTISSSGIRSRLAALTMLLLFCTHIWAQKDSHEGDTIRDNDVVTRVQAVAVGQTNVLDTYLSPAEYTGTEIRYISHTTRQELGSHISRQIVHQGNIAELEDQVGKGNEIAGLYDLGLAWHYNWSLLNDRLLLQAGGQFELGLGVIYNTRNSNNPAQMRLFANIGPSTIATYKFRMFHHRCNVRYEVSVPLVGLMFSPNYGQSYYEIFSLGNYDHNCVITTMGNAPSLRHSLSLDMSFKSFTLRVGYLGDFQQAKVNHLKQYVNTHALMIGFVKKFSILKIEN